MQEDPHDQLPARRPAIKYSRTELKHIGLAVLLLSFALALVLADAPSPASGGDPLDLLVATVTDLPVLVGSFLAVGSGFVLHELAHKIVAQRYGHWAEFRAQFRGLGLSILVAFLIQFLFAAPGAVLIRGRVTVRENGIISLVGPATNLVIAGAALPFAISVDIDHDPVAQAMGIVALVNAILALFNMLPFGIFDGRKVWAWSRPIYLGAVVVMLAMLVLVFVRASPV